MAGVEGEMLKSSLNVNQRKPLLWAPWPKTQDMIFDIENRSEGNRIGWKVKCTDNNRYDLHPVCGIVGPGEMVEVVAQVQPIKEQSLESLRGNAIGIFAKVSQGKDAGNEMDRFKVFKDGEEEGKGIYKWEFPMRFSDSNLKQYFDEFECEKTQKDPLASD